MAPCFPKFYTANCCLINLIFFRSNVLHSHICANFSYVFFGQFCKRVFGSYKASPVTLLVRHIRGMRVPTEIGKNIISAIAVIMAAFKTLWPLADKSRHHKGAHLKSLTFSTSPKDLYRSKVLGIRGGCQNHFVLAPPLSETTYAAKIGDFIKVFVAYNWEPVFHVPVM